MVWQAESDDGTDLLRHVFGSAGLMAIDAASILSQSGGSTWFTGIGITYALIAGVCVCLGWTIESHPWRTGLPVQLYVWEAAGGDWSPC